MDQYPVTLNQSEILLHSGSFSITMYAILLPFIVSVVRASPFSGENRSDLVPTVTCARNFGKETLQEKFFHSSES